MAAPSVSEVDALCDQARRLMKERKIAEARAIYEDAVVRDPRSIPAHEGAATAAFAEKDFEKAVEHFKKLTLLDLRRAQPSVNLGASYNRLGDFNAAIRAFRTAIARDKKCAAAYYNMGIAHKGLHQLSMAVTAYKEAVRIDPTMFDAHYNLANTLLEMGSFQQAIVHFEKALESNPAFEKARIGLKKAQSAKDDSKKSQGAFGRLVDEGEAAKKQDEDEYRLLTPRERQEDRMALHALAKEVESFTTATLSQLQEDLAPALQHMQHIAAQGGDSSRLIAEGESLAASAGRFRALAVALREKLESVREHERMIRD